GRSMLMLELRDVTKSFRLPGEGLLGKRRTATVLRGVSLEIRRGEILGLVGESGSGKSTLSTIAIRLADPDSGQVLYKGEDISRKGPRQLAGFRAQAQMVFQDSTSSLNPRKTVVTTLAEALAVRGLPRARRRARAAELLDLVGLGAHMLDRHPHQLSGGQRQRVSIARALATEPEFLIAD